MKKDPVVLVKQTWDPRQRIQEENSQGTIENGKSRSTEVLSTGEEFADGEEVNREVVNLPIRRPIGRPTMVEAFEGAGEVWRG